MAIYFMLWVIIQYYFIYLDAPAVVIRSFFSWLLYPFGILPSLWIFFLALPYFLTLQDAPGSPCLFPSPALESAISPRTTLCLSLCLQMPSSLIFPTALWHGELYPPSQIWIGKEKPFAKRMKVGASIWVNIYLLQSLHHLYWPVILQNGAISLNLGESMRFQGEEEWRKRAEWSHWEVRRSWGSCFYKISTATEYTHSLPLLQPTSQPTL